MIECRYAIVGGGVAAGYAARALAEVELEAGELVMVSAETVPPYDRPPLSKSYLLGKKSPRDIAVNQPSFYADHRIGLHLNTMVMKIDTDASTLELDSGERIHYEQLLIATGSNVRKFPRQATGGADIHYLRSLHDSDAIRDAAQWSSNPLIVGGGYIGLEVAAGLAQLGLEVRVVYAEKHLLHQLFTDKMHRFFTGYFEEHGVRFIGELGVHTFSREGANIRAHLDLGASLICDFVLAGIGVMPATDLFEGTDIDLNNGVVVNTYLQTSVPNIYAAGDVTNYPDPIFHKRRRIEHWQNAVDQGRCAAYNMIRSAHNQADKREPYHSLPYFFSDMFDLSWEFWGDTANADEVIYTGDFEEGHFGVWWLQDEIVRGAFLMGRPDEERELAMACIREQREAPPMIFSLAQQE